MADWNSRGELERHFRRHRRLLRVRTVAAYDASARETIDVGTCFVYRDLGNEEPRVGYDHLETRRFVGLSDDEATILTHYRTTTWRLRASKTSTRRCTCWRMPTRPSAPRRPPTRAPRLSAPGRRATPGRRSGDSVNPSRVAAVPRRASLCRPAHARAPAHQPLCRTSRRGSRYLWSTNPNARVMLLIPLEICSVSEVRDRPRSSRPRTFSP